MIVYNNNSTSKVFYSGFTITKIYACGGELVWSESPFTFKAQYTLNDATSGEVVCNGSSTLTAYEFDDAHNIRNMIVGECVDTWEVPVVNSYTSLRTLDLSHSNITTLPEKFMKGVTTLREVSLNPSTTTISSEAFKSCTSLTAITIPSSVTSIGANAFENSGLKNLTIKSGVTYSTYVYKGCNSLSSVTIEQGTRMIEQGTFSFCTGLTSVEFPSSIVYLGVQAFMGCRGMEYMIFHSTTPPNLGEDALNLGVNNSCIFYVPCSAMAAYLAHEDWQPFVDRIRPIESDCSYIQYRWTPSGTTCVGFDKYENSIKQVTYNSGTTWQNVSPAEYSATTLIEQDSEDCGYIEPQYRTISTATTCIGNDKHYLDEAQVSLDGGVTWETTATTTGALIEANSYDCGYRTRTVSTAVTCVGVDKYYLQEYQTSTDSGSTWTTVSSTTGSLIEAYSYDCGYRTRETSGSAYCNGTTKYIDVYSEYSEDGGQTWHTASTTPTLIEEHSFDCGYRTRTLNTATTCVNVDKYTLEEYQVSTDSGSTWTTTGTSATTLIEANSYDCGYRTRQTSGTPYCDGDDLYVDVYSQVSTDSGSTWETTATTKTLVEAGGCAIEPQYRTLTTATTCVGVDKHTLEEYQVSYDEGETWTTTATSATTLIEANSYDCGYRTRQTSGTPYCDGYDKYQDVYDQVSTDSGSTWTTTATTPTLLEHNSEDCGYVPPTPTGFKFKITHNDDSISSAACDSTSAITKDEVTSSFTGQQTRHTAIAIEIGDCVTEVASGACYYMENVSAITIGNNVTTIGKQAMGSLYSVSAITLPNSLITIDDEAFSYDASLSSITIPDSVTTIGVQAFYQNGSTSKLRHIDVGSGVTSISTAAFNVTNDGATIDVIMHPTTPPSFVGNNPFQVSNISASYNIYIPNAAWNDYMAASQWYALRSYTKIHFFTIDPEYRTVSTATTCVGVDKYAVDEYQMTQNRWATYQTISSTTGSLIEADSEDCGYVPPTPNAKFVLTLNDSSIVSGACDSSSAVTVVEVGGYESGCIEAEFGNCVTTIGASCFNGWNKLSAITIPNSVTTIGNNSFKNCVKLENVNIPDSVTTIEGYSFYGCTVLTSVTIGSGCTSIGDGTFQNSRNLASFICLATNPPTLGNNTFYGTTCSLYVPAESVEAYKAANRWSQLANRIFAIPNS